MFCDFAKLQIPIFAILHILQIPLFGILLLMQILDFGFLLLEQNPNFAKFTKSEIGPFGHKEGEQEVAFTVVLGPSQGLVALVGRHLDGA